MRKKRKNNKRIAILFLVLIVIIGCIIAGFFLLKRDEDTNLNLIEKQWIESHKNDVYDVAILNNLPIFGYEGKGLFFDFINNVKEETGLNFNLVPYNLGEQPNMGNVVFQEVDSKATSNKQLVFGEDKFVIFSKTKDNINTIANFSNAIIGSLKDDTANVSYYLGDATNVTYNQYETIDELTEALDTNKVNYIVIPHTVYLSKTLLKDDYYVVFHLDEMGKSYVLTLSTDNNELNTILSKYYEKWSINNNDNYYEKAVSDLYFNIKNISATAKSNFLAKRYIYGTVDALPFETMVGDKFIGINEQYLNEYSKIFGVEISFKEYNDYKSLQEDFNKGNIDIIFNNFNKNGITNENSSSSIKIYDMNYVLVSNRKNTDVINSLKSLRDKNILVVKDTALYNHLKTNSNANLVEFNTTTKLLNKINTTDIIAIDKATYEFYNKEYFTDFNIVYSDKLNINYDFILNNKKEDSLFVASFNYFIESVNNEKFALQGLNSLEGKKVRESFIQIYLQEIIVMLSILVLLATFALVMAKRRRRHKEEKKDEKIKYIDSLTALKNRNYLNSKIKVWDENVIYPQVILVIDLNNIKYINEAYGHEEGDEVIKGAANILITTQLENSDVIRTDGNEFLVYLVGQKEEKIVNYISDLKIRFEEIPHAFGAAIGYSMIEDDIKTIDDAINEATLDMRNDKKAN